MEVMAKSWTLVGAPSVTAAWYSLREVVDPKDIVANKRRQDIAGSAEARAERAKQWFKLVFDEDEDRIFGGFARFSEFGECDFV